MSGLVVLADVQLSRALSLLCSCPQTSTVHMLGSFIVVSAHTPQFKFPYITYILKVIDFTMEMALVDILTECSIFAVIAL